MTKQELAAEALTRARFGQSTMNFGAIFAGFIARGIAESDIHPRVNVLTYNAWKAAGRQVRKGAHGVRVVTFVPMSKEQDGVVKSSRRPKTTTVFHITQTDPIQ